MDNGLQQINDELKEELEQMQQKFGKYLEDTKQHLKENHKKFDLARKKLNQMEAELEEERHKVSKGLSLAIEELNNQYEAELKVLEDEFSKEVDEIMKKINQDEELKRGLGNDED